MAIVHLSKDNFKKEVLESKAVSPDGEAALCIQKY